MPTGKRLLSESMPNNYKQGFLYPVNLYRFLEKQKPYGNKRTKHAGHVRKAGQNKVRKQLKKELEHILEEGEQEI